MHCGHTPLVSHTLLQLCHPPTQRRQHGRDGFPPRSADRASTYVSQVSFAGAVVAVRGHGALRLRAGCLDGPRLCLQEGNRQELALVAI